MNLQNILNNKQNQKAAFFTLATLVVLFLLWQVIAGLTGLRVVSSNPKNQEEIPVNAAVRISLSSPLTNADQVRDTIVVDPAITQVLVESDGNDLLIFPAFGTFIEHDYKITLNNLESDSKKLDRVDLSFTASKTVDNLSNRNKEALKLMDERYLHALATIAPGIDQVVTSQPNYDINYSLFGAGPEAFLQINLDPEDLPPRYRQDEWPAYYESARNEALAFIASKGVELESFKINYTPKFMDDLYGNHEDETDHSHEADLGIPEEQ